MHFSLGLKGILITLLQYRFSSLTFPCSEPTHTHFLFWILPTTLHHTINFLSCSLPLFSSIFTNTQLSSVPPHFILLQLREENALKPANHSPAQNSLFIQRAQQSPLATGILVYLPSVPSYDCHDNKLVAMPIFRCHCVVFVTAVCTSHLLLFSISFPFYSHLPLCVII